MGMAFKSADELNAERLADRHVHLNSNSFVLGTSSAGKSFKVKFELAHWFLNQFDVEPIVIDPDMSDGGVGSSAVKPNNSVIAFSLRRLAPSLVGMLSMSSAWWSRAQESQYPLICVPMPLPLQSSRTAMASVTHTRSRTTCAAFSHSESPKKDASSTAGRTKAPPIRRPSAHNPIKVGLIVPSSSTRGFGSEPFQRCSISLVRSVQTSCASASSRTGPPTGSSGSTR